MSPDPALLGLAGLLRRTWLMPYRIDVDGGQFSVLGKHDDAVSAIEWCEDQGKRPTRRRRPEVPP